MINSRPSIKTNGKLLWEHKLEASAHATPATYAANGRQFVVIAAGGTYRFKRERFGDALVAFALPPRSGSKSKNALGRNR